MASAFVHYGNNNCTGKMFGLGNLSDNLYFWGACRDYNSGMAIPMNEWSFVAVVYIDSVVELYLNNQVQTKTVGTLSTLASQLFFGAETINDGSSFRTYFKGSIDDIRIYNRSLSESEIQELYTDLNNGLVAYYPFNGNANDESENVNDGTVNGATLTEDRFGNPDSAYSFDGVDDYIISANMESNFSDETVTISVWFNAISSGIIIDELGQDQINIGHHDSQIEILSTGEVKVRVWSLLSVSLGTVYFGTWHHVVLRYDKATFTLDGFLDGEEALSDVTGDRLAPWESGYELYNGLYYAFGSTDFTHLGSGTYFNGVIDDIRIYDRAISESEIQELYQEEASCASIDPTSESFTSSGGNGSVSITTDSGETDCNWTAISKNPGWIKIESGSSGSGDGEVTYSITENTKTTERTGIITIAGKAFEITQNGIGITDITDPSVRVVFPENNSTTELVYFIHGTLSDKAPSSGIDRVEIQVSNGSGNYLGPEGWSTEQWIRTELRTTASGAEVWFYDTGNVAWEDNVGYEVTAKVYDYAGNTGEEVISFTFQETAKQLPSTLSLGVSSNAILQEDTIDVSGKLTRLPDDGTDLSGETITLTITAPDGSDTEETTETYDSYGHYLFEGITGFTQNGTYTIQASFNETTKMAASTSDEVSLQVGPFAGYAIIVEGKVSGEEGLPSHNKTTNNIYNALLERGFIKGNIYYFNYDVTQDVDNDGNVDDIDGVPSKTLIQNAIAVQAKDMMNSAPAPLYIILHDHGSTDKFYLDNEVITPSDLDSWLDTLESGLNSDALLEKRVIIYAACYSGSFINVLSKKGRVIVTSAATNEESYKGPMEPDGIRSGSYFLEGLFKELERGYSIKDSFEEATENTELFTRSGNSSTNTSNAYFDSSEQHPLLDDDGDGVGSNALTDNVGDGQVAKDIYLGVGETLEALPDNQVEILYVTETLYISPFETDHLWWAHVNNNDQVGSAWMEIRLPSQTLSGTGGPNTEQLTAEYIKTQLSLNAASGNWELKIPTKDIPDGLYEFFYFVSDKTTGEASAPMRSIVYKDKVGNNPPYTFSLVSPFPASEEKTSLIFRWNAAYGPDEEDTTYTYNLLIATDEEFNNVVYKDEEITTTFAIVDAGAGLSDLTIYYWKVQAIDAYGLTMDSAETWPFYTNNTNYGDGFISGRVNDIASYEPIVGAEITTDGGSAGISIGDGYYYLIITPGTYTVTGSYNGYSDASFSEISVSYGETTELNFPMTSTDPIPDIKANGSDGPVNINLNDNLSVTDELDPGDRDGENADWWVYATTSFGTYWYTLDSGWVLSDTPIRVHGGPLFNLAPYTILEMSTLPIGNYVFNFEVDNNMDNVKDGTYTDSVEVNIQ